MLTQGNPVSINTGSTSAFFPTCSFFSSIKKVAMSLLKISKLLFTVYKLEEGEWTLQQSLQEARYNHACEVLTIGDTEVLIVVGGFNDDETGKSFVLDTVEIFNSTSGEFETSEWIGFFPPVALSTIFNLHVLFVTIFI